jgi:hypothetical protein
MHIQLKTGQIIKIITLIPKAFHATHLTVALTGSAKPTEIKIYFSYSIKDLENKNFDDLPYIQFKSESSKPKDNFKPVYNTLDKAYDYCFIETDKPAAAPFEVVLHYEGM